MKLRYPNLIPLLMVTILCVVISGTLHASSMSSPVIDPSVSESRIESTMTAPLLREGTALFQLYQIFPHLLSLPHPTIALDSYLLPSGPLHIYSYSWDVLPSLYVEQNADSGEIMQYLDFSPSAKALSSLDRPRLSSAAALMLAQVRFEQATSAVTRMAHYPEPPEIRFDEDRYIIIWTKHYLGIPYFEESFIIAIDSVTGMPELIVENRDFSLVAELALPDAPLSHEDARSLVRENIAPVLVTVPPSEDKPEELVWFSGITVNAFLLDGTGFDDRPRVLGVQPDPELKLLVSQADALLMFRENFDLEKQWLSDSYYDEFFGRVTFLDACYVLRFTPLSHSLINVIPALIPEKEFIAKVLD